jgi:predicted dehydrogenase
MNKEFKLGVVGCDTSHCVAFARILNDPSNEHHVSGARITSAWPGGSPDFDLSISRVEGFVEELRGKWQVDIVDTPEAVAERSDGVLLTSVDGRVHLEQFRKIAAAGKPVFIDKPFALKADEAREMFRAAREKNIPLMSCSSLRYSDGLVDVLNDSTDGTVFGADFYGPMALQPTQPGLFWYGIHTVEMLFAALGKGCSEVTVRTHGNHDVVVALWKDGRMGTIRGNRMGNNKFGGVVHREKGSSFVDVYASGRPYYASLLEQILLMFNTATPPIDPEETVEIVRFIEAANESRESGKTVRL